MNGPTHSTGPGRPADVGGEAFRPSAGIVFLVTPFPRKGNFFTATTQRRMNSRPRTDSLLFCRISPRTASPPTLRGSPLHTDVDSAGEAVASQAPTTDSVEGSPSSFLPSLSVALLPIHEGMCDRGAAG